MKFDIGCYYFPNYHTGDARNDQFHGKGWSEWDILKQSVPRFPGHYQPRTPLWGSLDEKDPQVMAQKIDAAADAGISVFIFDWYYYNDGPFLERALEQGFMKAPNRSRMKFCNMWANHNWYDIHPSVRGDRQLLYPGAVTRETFEKIAQIHIDRYFSTPEYYTIDGAPYFSVYELTQFVASFGSLAEARRALADFKTAAKAAGYSDVHLNAIVWGQPILPGESKPHDPVQFALDLGFDSVASYVWAHHSFMDTPQYRYTAMRDDYFAFWDKTVKNCPVEYFPNVSMGWDTAPRTIPTEICTCNDNYPYGPVVTGNTPEEFAYALQLARRKMEGLKMRHPFLTINSWNEWTEGSYLEPDTVFKNQYLDAVRRVFPE